VFRIEYIYGGSSLYILECPLLVPLGVLAGTGVEALLEGLIGGEANHLRDVALQYK
jgi:hypothetical protein